MAKDRKQEPAARKPARKPAVRRRKKSEPTEEQIAQRAYELWLAGEGGDAFAHWVRAERELVAA